jgi:hypothetical protein
VYRVIVIGIIIIIVVAVVVFVVVIIIIIIINTIIVTKRFISTATDTDVVYVPFFQLLEGNNYLIHLQ